MVDILENEGQGNHVGSWSNRIDWPEVEVANFKATEADLLHCVWLTSKRTAVEHLQFDFTLGVELGYFYIRDVFRNMEFVISSNYHTQAKVISGNIGFKFFLNLRANR